MRMLFGGELVTLIYASWILSQVAAMRLVSGVPYRSNIQSLYIELDWQKASTTHINNDV